MPNSKYAVEIDDLDTAGPELSDQELLAVRGGWWGIAYDACSCVAGGGYDWDNPTIFFY